LSAQDAPAFGSPAFMKAFRESTAAFHARVTASPEAALKQLKLEGIVDGNGNLAKRYGG
jgi:hypothetical protein